MDNTIYPRQLAILMFVMGFTFKASKLPSLVADCVGTEGVILALLYLILEIIEFIIVYRFISTYGKKTIENTKIYKVIAAISLPVFFLKLSIMASGVVDFTTQSMFESIKDYEVLLPLLLLCAYIGYKGIITISRTAELMIWLVLAILLLNLLFLKGNLNIVGNLPLLVDFQKLIIRGDRFFVWFGDYLPFIFLSLTKTKKRVVFVSLILSSLMILLVFVLMYMMYGPASKYIGNIIVKVASFNQFSDKLGRLDWTGMIVWIILAILYLSIYFWAISEAFYTLFHKKIIGIVLAFVGTSVFVLLSRDIYWMIDFAMGEVRWFVASVNYLVPVVLLVYEIYVKRKNTKGQMLDEQPA